MAYTSNSEFDLETRVQITNETPTLRSYQQTHHSLQNDTWKWLIGTEDVSYDLPVGGKYVTITDDDGNEVQSEVQEPPVKIVNGKQASVYGPSVYNKWDVDSEAYVETTPTYHRMEINGTLSVEQDLFLHEIYRYLNCIYPDHPDWLNLLTRNEILDAFNNAAAMVDYKPNNEFFKLVADSIDSTESDVEEFKLNLRNLTSNAARRKFYGSTLGYRMMGHDSYENIMVFPIGKNLTLAAQSFEERAALENDDGTFNVKKYIIDTFDERYQTLFRRIDWLGENRDTSFISSNGYSFSTYVIPGYESFAFEFASSEDGEYTVSDYKLYNDSAYSFYSFEDSDVSILGSISGTNTFNVLEPSLNEDADQVSYTSSDDKLYALRTSANNNVQYFELYKFKPFEEYEEFIRQYALNSVITYWGDQYNSDGTTSSYTTRSWLNNYLDKLFVVCSSYEVLKDNSSIYDKVQFLYNPFVKNTIMFPVDQMIDLYDTKTDFDGTDVVPKDNISLKGCALEEGDLIAFRDFSNISNGVVYGVAGASYGYINFSFPGNLEVDDYNTVVAYKPFDVSDDTIVSKEYMSIIVKNSNGDYIEFQGSMKCNWAIKRDGVKVASYLDTATFFIRAIPDTKSDTLFTLLYGTDATDTIESIEESIENNEKALAEAKALIKQELNEDLYGTPIETYEELSAKDSLTDEEKEQLANAINILETYTYSYWQDYKSAEEAIAEDKEDLATAQEEYNNLKKNRDLLLEDDVLTVQYDNILTKIYVIGAGDTYSSMDWMLEEGSITEFSLGNISVIPVVAGENYCLPDWHTYTNNNNNKDYCLVKLDYKSVPRDSTYYQLYSNMYDTDRAAAFVPSATTSIYNEKTYTIEAQVYVDKEVGTTTNEMQFLTEDAKKKFDSICVGSKVTGPGISSDTYVTSLSNNSLTISTTLPNKGYFTYKFECPVTTSPEEIDDPFNYKKVMNTFGNYEKVSFFDHGVYGTSEWPNVSSVVFDGDLRDKQIIAPNNFLKVVKKLYEDKLEKDDNDAYTNILIPSIGKYTRDVFIDIKADRLIDVPNKVGNTNNLMNVEWLDYIQNNSELALAKENINVGANIILNADTSGYASLLQDSYYTDTNLQTLFQTLNWTDSTIPAYVQLGIGGSGFSDFWKLISNIYYPNVYGATFYDRLVQPEEGAGNDEDNVTDWREVGETSLSKRATYAKVGKISSKLEAYSSYENIDNPIFEIPLNEYNINLKTYQNSKTYTTVDALFYEQGFKNLTTEKELKIAKNTDLSTSFINGYQSISSLSSSIADSIKYYYLADGNTAGENKADLWFTIYDKITTEHTTRWQQYEIYNGGTIGANIYYFNNSFYSIINSLFNDITYSQYKEKCKTDMIDNPEEVLRQILLLTTYYYSSNENVNNGLTLKNKFLIGQDLTIKYTDDDIVIDNSWFENKLILFSYIKGCWDKTSYNTNEDGMILDNNGDIIYYDKYQEAVESLEDYFGLKDFDTIGLLWDGEKPQLVYINKNFTICTTDSIKNLALLTQNQYNIFYGYSSYSIFSTYGKAAIEYREMFPGLEDEEDPTKWTVVSNDLSDYYMDISNSFIKYTSSIYNIIQLPRKYITDGSYELNLFIDPQFIGEGYEYDSYINGDTSSTVKYNISQSAIKYDSDNDLFYTTAKIYDESEGKFEDKNTKIVVKFEEQKYFKDLKFLYGAYKTELTQSEGSTSTTTEAYIRGITGESFDISDLSTSDKFVYAEEIDLRSLYTSSFNTRMFQGTKQLKAEIYGVREDGTLYISGKRNKTIGSRLYDSDFLSMMDAIIPAEVNGTVVSKLSGYTTGVDFDTDETYEAPQLVNVEIKKSINSGYSSSDDYTFKYYKNLLVFEGTINLKKSNTVQAPVDNSSAFTEVCNILSAGDKVKGIVALSGGGYNTHTIMSTIKKRAQFFAAKDDTVMLITTDGSIYYASGVNYESVNSVSLVQDDRKIGDGSGTVLNIVWSDEYDAFLATVGLEREVDDVFGYDYWKTSQVYALPMDSTTAYSTVFNTEFTTNTKLFTTNDDGVNILSGSVAEVPDIKNGDYVRENAYVNPDDIAFCSYQKDTAPTSVEDPSIQYGLAYDGTNVVTSKEGPYIVREPVYDESAMETTTYKLFSDGDIDIALCQEYMFAKSYNYKVNSSTGNYLSEKTKSKHWKAVRLPIILDYTLLHLKTMNVQGTNSAYNYVKSSFATFTEWCTEDLLTKADENDTSDISDSTIVKFDKQQLQDSYTYGQLKAFIAAATTVKNNLMTFSDFCKSVKYYAGSSTAYTKIVVEGTQVSVDNTNYTAIPAALTKVSVDTKLPLVADSTYGYVIKTGASYTLTGTTDDYIIQSIAYKNYVNFEEMYYQYLYLAIAKVIGELTSQNFGTKAISDITSNNSKLYLKTITNDIISISKSNLYKAADMRDPLNWNVAKMPTGTYVKGSYETKAADYNLVYFNDGSTTIKIPVSARNFNVYLYRLTTDIYVAPDGTHLFIGGYTVPYADIKKTLTGQMSADDADKALSEEWFTNNVSSWLNGENAAGSAPCIIYSDDAGQSFKVLPTKEYLDDYLFSNDYYEVSSFDTYQDSVIAYVKNQKSGGYEAKQIIIDFDAASGAVDTTATDYKQVSIAPDGKIHKQELDEGYITWSDGRVGFGVDIDQSQMAGTETFNFDYTGSNVLTLPNNLTVKRVDADSFAFDKGVTAGDLTSGQVRVLISISTANDITNPLEYITNDTSKLYEYENKSTGYFKVPTIEEVSNYQTADRIYSSRYIDPQYDNSGDIIGYPTVDEDLAGTASMYEYELNDDESLGSVVSLTNILGNDIKLCSEDGQQLLFSDGSLYTTEDLIRSEIDFDNAMTAGKNAVSISDAISNISKMETVEDITQSFAANTITLSKFYTDDFYALLDSGRDLADMKDIFSGIWWPISGEIADAADELLSYDGGEGNSDLINFILEKEGYWNYTDNPFSSATERFEIKDSQTIDSKKYVTVWDNKYNCYILNKRLFISGTLVVPYTFYNSGNGITVIPDPQVEYDDDYKMTGDGYLASGVYYHPMGYGGLRNNDSITDNTPWDRDPAAFENKLLKNSLGEYVRLTDEYGNLVKVYNSVQVSDGTETVSYDDFLNDGDNKIIIQDDSTGEVTTKNYFKLYKLTETSVHQLHSSKCIGANSSLILRVYNNAEKATSYGIQEDKGFLYNAAGEEVCPITVEGNVLKTGAANDVDTNGTLYAYLTAEIKVGDNNTETENFTAEFTWKGGLLAIDETSDDENDVLYQKNENEDGSYSYIALTATDNTGNIVEEYTYHTPTVIGDDTLSCDLTSVTIDPRPVYTLDGARIVVTGNNTFTYTKNGTTWECTVTATSTENVSNGDQVDIEYVLSVDYTENDITKQLYTATYTDSGSQGVTLVNAFLNGDGIASDRNGTDIVVGVTVGMTEFNEVVISYNTNENIYCPVFVVEDPLYKKLISTDSDGNTIYEYYLGDAKLDTSENSAFYGLSNKNINADDIDSDTTALQYGDTGINIGVSAGDIITGLYGYCVSKVPKYKTFSDLIYNLGVMIRKVDVNSADGVATHSNLIIGDDGDYYYDERDGDDLTGFKISAVADDGSELKLTSAPSLFEKYDDHKEHYFLFKILTIAHQNVAAANMNNEEFFREVSISEMSTFPPDRVWYNPKGTPIPPITVGEVILNEANNYAYYNSDYVNANHYKIRICDEYGRYINYTTSGNSYRLDSNNDGDCSEYVYSGYDGRYVSPEPVNATCQEWYKENMWAKNKDVNPLWQVIHIVPKIENKVWTQDISLKRYEKSGNNQVLIDVSDNDAYLNILPVTSITAADNIISYDNDAECFNLTKGTLQLLLSEGSSYYEENTEVIKYGLHFDTSNIANMYTNEEFNINSTLQASYTVNSTRDFTTSVQGNRDIVQVTELGIFDKNHKLIAYANFPPVEYRTSSQHLAFTCIIYYGNMIES